MRRWSAIWIALAAIATVAVSGCAGAPERPDWIDGSSKHYSANRYLVGLGQARTPAEARDRARADLAKNFQVRIEERTTDVTTYSGSGGDAQLEQEISRNVTTRTDQILSGVRVAEQWREPKGGRHYALAVLDRLQAGVGLRQEVAQLDAATREALQQARGGADLLGRIGAARRAVAAQVERTEYQRLLKIIDSSGLGAAPTYDLARLQSDLSELLGRVRISAEVSADPLGDLKRLTNGALAKAGFLNTADPDYVLQTHLDLAGQFLEGWHWQRGTLEVTLVERASGRVRGTHQWPLKASARQAAVAEQRARTEVQKLLNGQLQEVIIGFSAPR